MLYAGVKVLIAEDNRVNLEFAKETIEKFGCEVKTAKNGKIAIEKCKQSRFDIIFMDVQMPEMDGLEAAGILKEMKHNYIMPDTPIIALTANAMLGDKEKCLAAGMCDYIPKPIRKFQIADVLAKWLPEKRHIPSFEHKTADPEAVLDMDVFNEMKAIMSKQLKAYIYAYINDARDKINNIRNMLTSNASGIIVPAHILKSSSRLMGGIKVSNIAAKIESAASENGVPANIETLYRQLESSFSELEDNLLREAA